VTWADSSPEGRVVLTTGDDSLVKIWDLRSAKAATRGEAVRPDGMFEGHTEGVGHVDAKGDGIAFLTSGKDQSIKTWDTRRATSQEDLNKGDKKSLLRDSTGNSLTSISTNETASTGSSDWDYRAGYISKRRAKQVHPRDVSSSSFRGHELFQTLIRAYYSPAATTGQNYIYTGSADGRVVIYDALTGKTARSLKGHWGVVRDVAWHPHEASIASSSWDGTVALWDAERDGPDHSVWEGSGKPPKEVGELEDTEEAFGDLDADGMEEDEDFYTTPPISPSRNEPEY